MFLGGGVDFVSNPLTASFAAGSSTSSVAFPVILDNVSERNEMFLMSLSVPEAFSSFLRVSSPSSATGIIIDSTGNVFINV